MSELKRKKPSILFGFLRAVISISIIGLSVGVATWLYLNPAHTKKTTEHEVRKIYVTTQPISFGDFPIEIDVMGKVRPAREMTLKAQVSGEIVEVSEHFLPGGFFKADEDILKIDSANYQLDVKSKRAALKQATATYQLEEGQQQIAKNEIEILQRNTGKTFKSTDLALRKPQLAQAKANLDAAKAALDIALLSLERTTLSAPFNAIVIERNTDLGNVIAAQNQLATLVATDEYWIYVDVPLSDLPWLEIPGTKAHVQLGALRGSREGKVLKQTGSVDEQSNLVSVIVRVPDPLLRDEVSSKQISALVLGDYVPVKLIGKTLKGAARIPQEYVHRISEGDVVWLEQGGRLVIQSVTVTYKDRKYAYITEGLEYAKNLVTSNIITPVAGMDITVQNNGVKE
jgi:RND family efflux transporter MFP subunit